MKNNLYYQIKKIFANKKLDYICIEIMEENCKYLLII